MLLFMHHMILSKNISNADIFNETHYDTRINVDQLMIQLQQVVFVMTVSLWSHIKFKYPHEIKAVLIFNTTHVNYKLDPIAIKYEIN